MKIEEYVKKLKKQYADVNVSGVTDKLAIQVNLTGETEGTFYVEIKDGALSIEPYEYNDRNALLTVSARNLEQLLSGRLNPVLALTLGKVKLDGDAGSVLRLMELLKKKA